MSLILKIYLSKKKKVYAIFQQNSATGSRYKRKWGRLHCMIALFIGDKSIKFCRKRGWKTFLFKLFCLSCKIFP